MGRNKKKGIKQMDMAEATGLHQSTLCRIFKGQPVGKRAAMIFGEITGIPWIKFMDMDPHVLREKLTAAVAERKQPAA